MITRISLTAFAVLTSVIAVPVFAENYEYFNPMDNKHVFTITTSPPSIAGGDLARPASICEKHQGFICIGNSDFAFAVPSPLQSDVTDWEYDGRKYHVTRTGPLYVLGVVKNVWYIESDQRAMKYQFVYSLSHGLLGFSWSTGLEKYVFLAGGAMGFGPQKSIREKKRAVGKTNSTKFTR